MSDNKPNKGFAASEPVAGDQPQFVIEVGPDLAEEPWSTVRGQKVVVRQAKFRPKPAFLEIANGHRLCVLGTPSIGMKIDILGAAQRAATGRDDMLREIGGEFAIIHSPSDRDELRLITCRFSYPTLFYALVENRFVVGTTFADLWELLAARGRARPHVDTFFDFLTYKRVFGDKTPEANTRMSGPARILAFDGTKTEDRAYWRIDLRRKKSINAREGSDLFADAVMNSIRRRTSDGRKYALFLSGGMDTRLLLACFAKIGIELPCVTIGPHENREVQVAREAASIAGMPHVFVSAPVSHYEDVFRRAARVAGGQYLPMAMFVGLEEQTDGIAEVSFHGHGFDYLFQGMYLPRWNPKIFGHTLFLRLPQSLPSDLVGYFMNTISYKIRADLDSFMIPAAKTAQEDRLRQELEMLCSAAREVTASRTDALEYLSFSNLARHYSCTDHWGINTLLEQRTISFDNDLFDFYQTVPTRLRFDARLPRATLLNLNKKLANLPAANHRFPIYQSSAQRTISQLADAGMRRLGFRPPASDDRFERMSMPFDPMLAGGWRPYVMEMRNAGRLELLDFLDVDRLNHYLDDRLADGAYTSYGLNQFLVGLLVVDQLLERLG